MAEYTDKFDRIAGGLMGLPGVRQTKPATVVEALPIAGNVTTYVIQTFRTPEQGFLSFVQIVDDDSKYRLVLPHRVIEALSRQRDRLTDRSTPASRERKRKAAERARRRKEREARRAAFAARAAG